MKRERMKVKRKGNRADHACQAGLAPPCRFYKWHNRFMKPQDRFMNELFRIVSGALRLDEPGIRVTISPAAVDAGLEVA